MHWLTMMVLVLFAVAIQCQTFQYSRGWTNGKRGPVANSPPFLATEGHSIQDSDGLNPAGELCMPNGSWVIFDRELDSPMTITRSSLMKYDSVHIVLYFDQTTRSIHMNVLFCR